MYVVVRENGFSCYW